MPANTTPSDVGAPQTAEIVGAAAPVIGAALSALPAGALIPGRITFSYLRNGVAVTVRTDITPLELRRDAVLTITETFVRAGWTHDEWLYNANPSRTARFRHPSTRSRTDIPTT